MGNTGERENKKMDGLSHIVDITLWLFEVI
jgi:hypothetical protein